ncbi:MAG: hypothetical protein RML15_00330 [Bacteroidota bacterium]|nr:hypothetical protein [Candidatus Kapabacteria bacterium]MCS7302091.1 hypothetical protein [Candidatus Kapabacteria bacterium]MCX7936517.1 hypothetical protein [Chlorobiota bacterium]MDW8074678.1 hypothetical protein [Bacteroidota bacterium]MDW8270846.1 hypothetical protein [Bacteroidota bacterium]
MSLDSNIAKVRRYVPLAHFATAAILLGAAFAGSKGMELWFTIAAVLSVLAGISFYLFMRHVERKLHRHKP